ncbi:hypothetical protein D9M72_324810 [compost metagenome]
MDALVDETRLVIVGIFVRPVADEVVVERRTALGAAAGGLPLQLLHDGRNGLQPLGLDQPAHVIMAELGAGAHRLHGGRIVAVAERQRHQLLDKAGAGAAGGGRLGMGAHVVERGQALGPDRLDNLALADAVAAADFRIIRQGCNGRHRVQRRPSLIGLAKDQRVAHFGNVGATLHQIVEPGAVAGLAVEHRADDAVLLEHQPLVDAGGSIAKDDLLASVAVGEIADRIEVDAGHLQFCRRIGMDKGGAAIAGQVTRGNPRHLIQRCHQAIDHAADLGAFAERHDVAVGRLHTGVDDDAAVGGKPRLLGKADIRSDADRHHDQCRRDDPAVVEFNALDLLLADDPLGIRFGDDLDATLFDRPLQQVAGGRVELPLHQSRHDVQDGDVHAACIETGCRFEAEKTATDDDSLFARLGRKQHRLHIVEIAIGDDTAQVLARYRNDEGHRTGRDHQLVVTLGDAMVGGDGLGVTVDGDDLVALVERDLVLDVPSVAVDDDLLVVLLARKHRRQHDAVVVDARLGIEDRHRVSARGLLEEFFQHAARRHAVADDHELFSGVFSHGITPQLRRSGGARRGT